MNLNKNNWEFINMNSPANLNATYLDDNVVKVEEYDRSRVGHCLVSKFFLEKNNLMIEATIEEMQDGAGFGIYGGLGAFDQYLYIAYFKDGIEARISNNTPNGDTFMFEGHKKFFVLAKKNIKLTPPFKTHIQIKEDILSVFVNEKQLLMFSIEKVVGIGDVVRAFVKSINENNVNYITSSKWKDFNCSGLSSRHAVRGKVLCQADGVVHPVKNANIHVEGYSMFWTVTDDEGCFSISGLPQGKFTLIAGKESMAFSRKNIEIPGNSTDINILLSKECTENIGRLEYPRKSFIRKGNWMSLNGYWGFDFDPLNQCQSEKWYEKKNHIFSKSIQVPFSWASLKGFGEEQLADSDTMHQANTSFNYHGITGGVGVYSKTFELPKEFSDLTNKRLHIGAISGVSKIWLNGKYLGNTIDTYEEQCFNLGKLVKQEQYNLVIQVEFPYNMENICMGKQDFWFTENPGIWQSVWIEEIEEMVISDVLIDYNIDDALKVADIKGTIIYEFEEGKKGYGNIITSHISCTKEAEIQFFAKESGFYKLDLEYTTCFGSMAARVMVNENQIATTFDTTINNEFTDHKILYLPFTKGNNNINIAKTEQLPIFKDANCIIKNVAITLVDWEKEAVCSIYFKNKCIAKNTLGVRYDSKNGRFYSAFEESIKDPKLWDFKKPNLYTVKTQLKTQDKIIDQVASQFGMRVIKTKYLFEDDVVKRIFLNNKPIYIRGILDQGYNPWGIYTYPYAFEDKKGSISFDIEAGFYCGYNMMRTHVKDNEPLWYDYCDEAGMLVWDEHPLAFYAKSDNAIWQGMYFRKLKQMARKHWYHPSILIYSTFNESWGIEGWHERSPWEDKVGIDFIKNAVDLYKKEAPDMLVIDNSGYGKTSKTDIVDYHCYPIGYKESRAFWERLMKYSYKGSTFNFFNKANRDLMKNDDARDLLQRNCKQPLDKLQYIGEETSLGQPLILSEFAHNDKNDKWIRIFDQLSGYIRMNITSQENEDTSPFNALRQKRDFGYVNEDMEYLSYSMINDEDNIILDYPPLSQVKANEKIELPVYVSSFSGDEGVWQIAYYAVFIDEYGNYIKKPLGNSKTVNIIPYKAHKIDKLGFNIPSEYKAAYIFVKLLKNKKYVNGDFIQLEIIKEDLDLNENVVEVPTYKTNDVDFKGLSGEYNKDGRNLFWAMEEGVVTYVIEPSKSFLEKLTDRKEDLHFVFELSSSECIEGVKITDEVKAYSNAKLYINDIFVKTIDIDDAPFDERAIFSRAASIKNDVFNFNEHQGYGYGYKNDIALSDDIVDSIIKSKGIHIKWQVKGSGIQLYGHRMGRHGINPMFILKGDRKK